MKNPGNKHVAIALTVAGSDSGGGAGIQADLKTFSARGVYGASCITALTAQNTRTVSAIHEVPPAFVVEQLERVLEDLRVDAIKIGMIASIPVIEAVNSVLTLHPRIPVVLDPVMVAKSGDKLLQDDALHALKTLLCPLATLITPNLPEAAMLLERAEAQSPDDMEEQLTALGHLGARSVLLKGGHLAGTTCTDLLLSEGHVSRHCLPRLETSNTHGTGCTLSSAIAAELAKGVPLTAAVQAAIRYVHGAIMAADGLTVGQGHGPVHHFHELWPQRGA